VHSTCMVAVVCGVCVCVVRACVRECVCVCVYINIQDCAFCLVGLGFFCFVFNFVGVLCGKSGFCNSVIVI
jgi:hypothetical protein